MLRSEGHFAQQIHSEVVNSRVRNLTDGVMNKECFRGGPPVDPQANGRAERAVLATKTEVRKMLRGAEVGPEWWPIAVRHLNEQWRRQRMGKTDRAPPFMTRVIVRRRYWKTKEMEPVDERVRYLTPSWVNHGHWIIREDETIALTRAVITNTKETVADEVRVALEDVLTPMDERKRLRGKKAVRSFQEIPEEVKEERRRRETLIQEEVMHAMYDDQEVTSVIVEGVKAIRTMGHEEGEEILQTTIVSPFEVKKQAESWRDAIQAEIRPLFETKKALKILERQEAEEMMRQHGMVAIPSKVVFTIKPDPSQIKG